MEPQLSNSRRRRRQSARSVAHQDDNECRAIRMKSSAFGLAALTVFVFISAFGASNKNGLNTYSLPSGPDRKGDSVGKSLRSLSQTTASQWLRDFLGDPNGPQQQKGSFILDDMQVTPRISGGIEAALEDYPFYVNSLPSGELCGGSLIRPDIVLTAAQCEIAFQNGAVSIGGILQDGSDGVDIDVESVLVHPGYDASTGENNIMLVKLSQESSAPVVKLNFEAEVPSDGEQVTVIGFGETVVDGNPSDNLLEVDVLKFSNEFCEDAFPSYFPGSQICTGTDGPCAQDSGGPLLTSDNTQVGVIAFRNGTACGDPAVPSIYGRVSAYEAFIQDGICELTGVCETLAPSNTTGSPTTSPAGGTTSPATATDSPVTETSSPAEIPAPAPGPMTSSPITAAPVFSAPTGNATSRPTPTVGSPTTASDTNTGAPMSSAPTQFPSSFPPTPSFSPTTVASKKSKNSKGKSSMKSKAGSKSKHSKSSKGKGKGSQKDRIGKSNKGKGKGSQKDRIGFLLGDFLKDQNPEYLFRNP